MSQEFRREYLLRLPLPLAQLYSRAYNAKDARSRHDNSFYLCEALVKLAAAPLIAAYLDEAEHGASRSEALDRLLAQLALPSLGQWLAMFRELARRFGGRPDAAAHPLGQVWGRLNGPRTDLPGLLALYRRIKNGVDGKPAGDQSCSPLQAFDALVQYRNSVFGHAAVRFESFYEKEMGPLLFPAVNDLLAEGTLDVLGPRGGRLVQLTELRILEDGRIEVGLRELTGVQGERLPPLTLTAEQASVLAPGRTAVLWPGRPVPLRLDPLLTYRESALSEDVLFLNRDRNRKQVEYLSYIVGAQALDKTMAPALAALLSRVVGHAVGEDQLRALQEQSVAETPSVEALFTAAAPVAEKVGDYEILSQLGHGGMGVVYLARQTSLGRLVALKMLPADLAGDGVALARFQREIRALGRCDHPNIVKVLAGGVLPDGRHYYAMEYVPGCDLEQVWRELSGPAAKGGASDLGGATLARAVRSASQKARDQAVSRAGRPTVPGGEPITAAPLPPLPEPPPLPDDPGGYARRVAALVRDAALALQAVHDQGLVHRDVKPSNLMLTADGSRLVLMDFGLAKGQSLTLSASRSGGLLGTLRYAAPEQLAAANMKVGPAADVRGLGVTLWELLTRRRLFAEAEDENALTALVLAGDVPRLRRVDPTLDRDLEAIVARATERSVADRIPTAGRLAEYLHLYLEGKPLPIRPPGQVERAARWVRRQPALASFIALFVLSLIGGTSVSTGFALVARDRAIKAEDSDKKTKDALKIVKEEKEQTEKTLATGLLRPLGHNANNATDPEVDALWDLARSNPRVRRLFVEQALQKPSTAMQLQNRADLAVHAAVGLDSNQRQKVEDVLLAGLRKESDFDIRMSCVLIGVASDDWSPEFAAAAARLVVQAMEKTNDSSVLRNLAAALAALALRLPPEQAAQEASEAAGRIMKTMEKTTDSSVVSKLAQALAALAQWLPPAQAAQGASEAAALIVKTMKKTGFSDALSNLAQALAALAQWLPPADAAHEASEAAALIVKAMKKYETLYLSNLAQALAALAPWLPPAEAADAFQQAVQNMAKTDYYDNVDALARALAALAPRLPPAGAADAARLVVKAMAKTDKSDPLSFLARAMAALAPRLPPADAHWVPDAAGLIVKAMNKAEVSAYDLSKLAQALAALAQWLPPAQAAQGASEAAGLIVKAMKKKYEFIYLRDLAQALVALAPWLPPAAPDAARTVVQALEGNNDDYVLEAVAVLAPWLRPVDAANAARLVEQSMVKTDNSYILGYLAAAMAALAPRLPPADAAHEALDAARLVVQALGKTDNGALPGLTNSLAALIVKADPDETSQRINSVASAVGNATTSPPLIAGLAPLAEASQPPPGRFTEQQLVDLLKTPTCRREARQVIVTQLGYQCGRPFANLWEFVDWAKENRPDLDLTSPPVRPDGP